MKHVFFASIILISLASCGGTGTKKIISRETKQNYQPMVEVSANRKLVVEVSGMSCEHACGGSIRMGLKETNAVDRVSFDFKTDRDVNIAYITFDKSKISADKIISIIEALNNKQFKTGKVTSTEIEEESTTTSSSTATSEQTPSTKVEVNTSISVPNIFKFFATILS